MKFDHNFKLISDNASMRTYACDDINARIDFVSDSAIRVALFKNGAKFLPTFDIDPLNTNSEYGRDKLDISGFNLSAPSVSVENGREQFKMPCGVEITLDLHNFLLSYSQNSKMLFRDRAPLAYNLDGEFGVGTCHYLSRDDNEYIYGVGDKGGDINKAGRTFRLETADSMGFDAANTDPLYKHIPFYICENSVGSYGIFYDTSCDGSLDFGREINNYYEHFKFFKSVDNTLVYYVFFGSKLEILKQFASFAGKQAFPPKWSFDYCASTMAYTDAPDAENQMNAFLDKIDETDLSCGGFYLSSGYTSIGNQRCVFNWNYDKFPDPKRFIKNFSDKKIELIPNIKPAFLTSHPMYNSIAQKGYFVKNQDGTPYVTQFWDGVGSYIDFTNPDAFDFWKNQVREKLLDNGITATWNDNNEFDIKDIDAVSCGFGDGTVAAVDIKPILTFLMNKSSYTAQTQKRPELRPFLSTRSGGIGVRRLAQTWSGDNMTSFHDLKYCHYVGLTLSMSGMFFYGHDLGGFSGPMPSKELLLRWIQHGIFEPRFTIHSWNSDNSATMPWSYPDVLPQVRKIFAQRKLLLPYLYNAAYNSVQNEVPLNAPLFLYYDEKEYKNNYDAMMFGTDILVAFVFDEGKTKANVLLPQKDNWYLGESLYHGGESVELDIPYDLPMPYFVKAGSVIPYDRGEYGFQSNENLVFTIYPLESGEFSSTFFTDDGLTYKYKDNDCVKLKFNVVCDFNTVTVEYENLAKQKITPNFELCDGYGRKLVIK